MKPLPTYFILLLWLSKGGLVAQSFGVIYPSYEIDKFQRIYQKSNQEIFDKALFPYLNYVEKNQIRHVRVSTPRTHRDDPWAYYTDGKTITMSAQSLMFFWDLCLAFTWLNAQGHEIGGVTDYVAMLRYRRASAFPGGRYPTPLKALGVPRAAEDNPTIYKKTLRLFNSGRAAIIAHEIGHAYHRHPGNRAPGVSRYQSRQNEMEADKFALDLLSRHPEVPVGWLFFQQITAHYNWDSEDATHPSSSVRISNTANFLENNIRDFARNGNSRQLVATITEQFRELANLLADEDLQVGIQVAAQKATIASLQMRRRSVPESRGSSSRTYFSGEYNGSYIRYMPNRQQETLGVVVFLQRKGQFVQGMFNFGFGNGMITEGQIINNKLYFNWSWGGQSGKGVLAKGSNGNLEGTWGYSQYYYPESNGGQWILRGN